MSRMDQAQPAFGFIITPLVRHNRQILVYFKISMGHPFPIDAKLGAKDAEIQRSSAIRVK